MKAILRSNRRVTVFVEYIGFHKDENGVDHNIYRDNNRQSDLYLEEELEWCEYYGG